MNIPSPFSADAAEFDSYDEFVPDHVPLPSDELRDHDVLAGRPHLATHRLSRALFEERGVYDMTFGYNLARLNLDARHPDAGLRYARSAGETGVLRVEFTPTTEFCPQSDTLAKGVFRAWNGLTDRHEYDLVRVRVADLHHRSAVINQQLRDHETRFAESGVLPDSRAGGYDEGVPNEAGYDREPDTPF